MLLWCDVETTGLDERTDTLLEIGIALTDDNLVEKAAASWVLPFGGQVSSFIADMHGANGLLNECRQVTISRREIAADIEDWLDSQLLTVPEKPPLCGSTVSFDRAFLKVSVEFAPILHRVHYRNIDVSSVKELCKRWAPTIAGSLPKPQGNHRALPDVRDSIAELRVYRQMFFRREE